MSTESNESPATEQPDPGLGRVVTTGLLAAGRAMGRAAVFTGRSLAAAYHAIDPDVRLHLAELPILSVSLLAPRRRAIVALPDDGNAPVLFVHGLGGNRGSFMGMHAWFRLAGRKRCYALGLPGDASLADMATAVQTTIAEILTANGLPSDARVDVVAHSMGGLVSRLALEHEETRLRVRTLVTLGTPHGGTFLARYGATPSVRELRPDSETMRTLKRQIPWRGPPEQPRLVCLWSPSDVLVLPAESAGVEGAENVRLAGLTHYGYLIHPRAAHVVIEALAPA